MTDPEFQGHNQDMQRFLIVASLGSIALGFYWPKLYFSAKNTISVATVLSNKGTTEWISRHHRRSSTPQKTTTLQMNESISTGTDGEMILRFKRGAEVRVLPSSFITLLRKANSTLIALRRGEIEVLQEGETNSVLVAHGGIDYSLRDYQPEGQQETLWIDPQSLDTIKTVDTETPAATSLEGAASGNESSTPSLSLTKDPLAPISTKQAGDFQAQIRGMIADRVGRQKNHLFRCYTTLIQKQKNASGKLDVHFTVNNLGKVEDPMIVKTEIMDKKFEKCLLQVIQRTDFQPFQGQKVSTFLPLRFEKNLNPIE
jgi:hypothetical protein